jgi:hypothetical protein
MAKDFLFGSQFRCGEYKAKSWAVCDLSSPLHFASPIRRQAAVTAASRLFGVQFRFGGDVF